jgi:predicted NUDIX family NTP pyrophosphohydrolase
MAKQSAGLLLYRVTNKNLEVFLAHPGGPFYTKKDLGSWSIPKGEFNEEEQPLDAAKREFFEETGLSVSGEFDELTPIKQKSGKKVFAWAVECNVDSSQVKSNTFAIEFPPKTGKMQEFPEIDRAEWFSVPIAKQKIISYQVDLISELAKKLGMEENSVDIEKADSERNSQPSLFG